MPQEYCATIYEEKPIARSKVSVAAWSPTMDVIAIGSPTGIVSLHRYKMGVNWEVHSSDSASVTHMAWRPDGNVLAVAYESGRLQQLNLSDGSTVYTAELGASTIQQLAWVSFEFSDLFSSRQEVNQMSKPWLDSDSKPSILIVYSSDNTVRFYGCGFYELSTFSLAHYHKIYECFMSEDLSSFCFFSLSPEGVLSLNKVPSPVLADHCLSLQRISYHVSNLLHCKQLLNWSLKQLQNAWESTLLELDTKLTTYSRLQLNESPAWSLRNELLEIILFGHVSPQLKEFFKHHWTPLAIRRAGISMFKAYDSIEAITFQQLQYNLMRLICEGSELLGCLRDRQNFQCFGLPEETVIELIKEAGTTLQKTQELHAVVNYCSQYLRPFFHWLHEVASSATKDTLKRVDGKISQSERNLVITFVSERLKPIFHEGQLKSYQIELVEQYIRRGGTTKPIDQVLGIQGTSENSKRAKLKDFIPLPLDINSKFFPEGVFIMSNSSLADLIEIRLAACIDKLVGFGEHVSSSGLFLRPESPVPLITNVSDVSMHHLCHASRCMSPTATNKSIHALGGQVCSGTIDRFAFVIPHNEGVPNSRDTIFVCSADPVGVIRGISIDVDGFATDDNPSKKPYHIVDLKFFEVSTLTALLYRESDGSSGETLQWIVFISLDESLAIASALPPISLLPAPTTLADYLIRSPVPLSSLVTEQLQVHTLPRKPFWFTLNDKRHTIFVMFDFLCRVFIMERIEIVDEVSS
ncbi:hypothetical protein Aperf_G00000031765 [Anoplocephala perfoliata]